MSEIPTLMEYDGKKAKVRCSIHWIISEAYRDQSFPKNLPQRDVEHVFESDGGLKKTISSLLCSGNPYCKFANKIFDLMEPLQSHEDVIQVLCSKGLYVLDESDSLITANDLRKVPLMLGAHLTIIDMLMYAYMQKLISVNSLVMTVRKFSEFSASKESPDNLEEGLILWLNKVSLKVQINHRNTLESDKHTFGQQREDDTEFPTISNLTEDLYDGKSIALLLHYYCPEHLPVRDISMRDPISIADAWSNLQISLNFCNDILLPRNAVWNRIIPPTVLHPVDLLYCGQEMKMNVMVLLGTLFHYLETEALEGVVAPLGHSVLCRRQIDPSFEDLSNNSAEPIHYQPLSITTMKEKHQHTRSQANHLVPGVQPLISAATKQSFRRTTPDSDSLSTITLNESEGRGSPAPFSSKPLLVRRNRDTQPPQLSPTSKPYTRTPVQHLPILKTQKPDANYTSEDGDSSSVTSYPKSSFHRGFTEDSAMLEQHQPVINRWHLRTAPGEDLRNTNTSNNIYAHRYDGYSTDRSNSSKPSIYTSDTGTSNLLSNVEMDNDSDMVERHSRFHDAQDAAPMPDFQYLLGVNGLESNGAFSPSPTKNPHRNDLTLETARTLDCNSARSRAARSPESSAMSDFTSVSSRTTTNTASSNEVDSQDFSQSGIYYSTVESRDLPTLISADESPELPRTVTRVKPYYTSDTGSSSVVTPSSQKSYTVRNREFQTIDSARAAESKDHIAPQASLQLTDGYIKPGKADAIRHPNKTGYPIIDNSPQNQHSRRPMRVVHPNSRSPPSYTSSNSSTTMTNGSGDHGRSMPMKARPISGQHDQMVIGGTVVKLRSPQRKSNRMSRNVKASSWMDQTKEKVIVQPSDGQRRHSNVPSPNRIVAAFKKLEERRKFIDTERRRIDERKKHIEQEKRLKEREWSKELVKIKQEMNILKLKPASVDEGKHRMNHIPNGVPHRESSKNEDTSSDYSSKSPSPSSMNNVNMEGVENEDKMASQFRKHQKDPDEFSESQNFFASPLSTTTYYVPRQDQATNCLDQSSKPSRRIHMLNQKDTFDVTGTSNIDPRLHHSHQQPVGPRDQTYNISASRPSSRANPHATHPVHSQGPSPRVGLYHEKSSENHVTTPFPTQAQVRTEKPVQTPEVPPVRSQQNATYDVPVSKETVVIQNGLSKPDVQNADVPQSSGFQSRQMTYDVSSQFIDQNHQVAHVSTQPGSYIQNGPSDPPEMMRETPQIKFSNPEIHILQPLPSEQTTRRSLFPSAQDPDISAEQENIDPNHLTTGRADQTSYDSFSHKIAGLGSNQSTPHKISPRQAPDAVTPPKGDDESDMSSVLLKTADKDRKGGKGFELVDEATPNTDVAKKKEQFLLKRLKKEEELKRKRADREKADEKRKEEARQKQEEIAAKKEEEKLKRQQIFEEYKKKKEQQEKNELIQQSCGIIAGGSSKKHQKPESSPGSKVSKGSRSGRSSPAPESQHLNHGALHTEKATGENHSTFVVSAESDINANAVPFRTRKMSGGRPDWETGSASSSAVSSEYTGPKLYKQPSSKSNKHIVYNAICHCCLPGKVNTPHRNSTIEILEMCEERHFMILFRDSKCQYRALYTYDPEQEKLHRITGNGPLNIVPNMIECLFKYNSGRKSFAALPSKTLSVSIDGITIKNALWQKKQPSAKK